MANKAQEKDLLIDSMVKLIEFIIKFNTFIAMSIKIILLVKKYSILFHLKISINYKKIWRMITPVIFNPKLKLVLRKISALFLCELL